MLRLFNRLIILPQHYTELFSAWYAIEKSIFYNEKEDDVYNFVYSVIQKFNLIVKWNDFIDVGITHIKDISF